MDFIYNYYIKNKINKIKIEKKIINKKNKKKILLLTDQIKAGGSERQLLRLASHLVEKKYDVLIVNLVLYDKNWLKKLNFFRSQIPNKIKIKTINLSNLDDLQISTRLQLFYQKKNRQ